MNGDIFYNSIRPTGSLSSVDHGTSNIIIMEGPRKIAPVHVSSSMFNITIYPCLRLTT